MCALTLPALWARATRATNNEMSWRPSAAGSRPWSSRRRSERDSSPIEATARRVEAACTNGACSRAHCLASSRSHGWLICVKSTG